jgi:hypothetical protein
MMLSEGTRPNGRNLKRGLGRQEQPDLGLPFRAFDDHRFQCARI